MLSRWPIRYKLSLVIAALCFMVAILAFTGFRGVYSFRRLTRSIKARATELPIAAELSQSVSNLRLTFQRMKPVQGNSFVGPSDAGGVDLLGIRTEFRGNVMDVNDALKRYKAQLDEGRPEDDYVVDSYREQETLRDIEKLWAEINAAIDAPGGLLDEFAILSPKTRVAIVDVEGKLEQLQLLSSTLPSYMKQAMDDFAIEAKMQYRAWIILTWTSTIFAGVILLAIIRQVYTWIFRPLKILIQGSRRVARGDFEHRITYNSRDEMSELAGAMNAMTTRFQQIRDELDSQVQQRTKEVVRSEQLASVGFLAAGVAHEINNPLASISWAAESLESRLHDIVHEMQPDKDTEEVEDITVLRKYLRRIQDESFRCKGITDRLLDYSRMGDVEKQDTSMKDLTEGVIDMVRDLGKYRQKHIEFECNELVMASVNPQEIKQVLLNLLTNGLDSIDPGGTVKVKVSRTNGLAEIIVSDDGCGMSEEVLKHLFEPFFTRRRDGQGTGLGLSITYRIIEEHGGTIDAASDGVGKGSRFRVTLPLVKYEEERQKQFQAA